MRFDVVRLTSILLAIFLAVSLMSLSALAQTAQTPLAPSTAPAQSQQTPAPTKTTPETDRPFRMAIILPSKPAAKPSQIPDDLVIFKDPSKLPPEAGQKALQEAARQRPKLLAENLQREGQRGSLDSGIYVRQVDGATVCGAIVSYNFSAGDNPQLQSVTTCTPNNAVNSQRARVRNPKPAGPQVLRTVYQEQKKK